MRRPEDALQVAVVRFLELQRVPGLFWTAINPVPSKSRATAGKSKAMGMRAGVPDLLFAYRGTAFFIELKAGTRRMSGVQKSVALELAVAGIQVHVACSVAGVQVILMEYGIPLSVRVAA